MIHPKRLHTLAGALVSILLAFLLGSVLIAAVGGQPLNAYGYMISGAFGSAAQLAATLGKTAVLVLCGLACAFAYKCGLINIGAQGQLYMGGLCSCAVGLYLGGLAPAGDRLFAGNELFVGAGLSAGNGLSAGSAVSAGAVGAVGTVPAAVVVVLSFLAGIAGGAAWGALAGWLKVRFGASEVITTVMLNYIALHFLNYMTNGPLKDPTGEAAKSSLLPESYWLPSLFGNSRIHIGICLALLGVVGFGLFFSWTKAGFSMRAAGLGPLSAVHAGIRVKRQWLASMAISGALAGLAGAVEVFGTQHQLISGLGAGYGFDGIAVSLLGGGSPLGILGSGLLFGAMKTGGSQMQMFGRVPNAIVGVIQGLMIIFVLVDIYGRHRKRAGLKGDGGAKADGGLKAGSGEAVE